MIAIQHGRAGCLQMLLDGGAYVDRQSEARERMCVYLRLEAGCVNRV